MNLSIDWTQWSMDPIDALRAFFLLSTCTTLSTILLPDSLRSRFVNYGPRATPTDSKSPPSKFPQASSSSSTLDYVASFKVPHSYFTQFYIASLLSSLFWATQALLHGPFFRAIASRISPDHLQNTMSIHQVMLCWVLMVVQGSRRLHESLIFAKPSSSQMWFVHWFLGLAFYLAVTVGVWIEGIGAILSHELTLDDVKITNVPSLRTFICLPIFLMASGLQHDCHHYLFSLVKYTLPTHPLFRGIVCPHYTAECVIYLSLAVMAAPSGDIINKTLLSSLAFVAVNLGITAASSKQWYIQKFGADSMQGRYNMIPGVY